jgi:hypothetical protein
MHTEAKTRVVKTDGQPEPNAVAYVSKCIIGIAITGLIGVIGVSFSERGGEKVAGSARMSAPQVKAAQAAQQQLAATRGTRQAPVEASARSPR